MVKMKILPDMLKFIWTSFTELLFLIKEIDIKNFLERYQYSAASDRGDFKL